MRKGDNICQGVQAHVAKVHWDRSFKRSYREWLGHLCSLLAVKDQHGTQGLLLQPGCPQSERTYETGLNTFYPTGAKPQQTCTLPLIKWEIKAGWWKAQGLRDCLSLNKDWSCVIYYRSWNTIRHGITARILQNPQLFIRSWGWLSFQRPVPTHGYAIISWASINLCA